MSDKTREKPRHLGRGLQSLLGPIMQEQKDNIEQIPISTGANFPIDKQLQQAMREIDIELVHPNPYQPRTSWDEDELEELARSIKTSGLVQPILVRPVQAGYELIAGERRLRAAKLAGLKTITAIVRTMQDQQMLEMALIENIHRKGLNPIERAKAYREYLEIFSLTQSQAAERLGEDRSVIANYIRLLDLPEQIQQMLIKGQLTMGHARAILAVSSDELRRKLANRALAGRLSVRELERLVRLYSDNKPRSSAVKYKPPHIIELESKFSAKLGTKVKIETNKTAQKGKIIIEFKSPDDFDRITEQMGVDALEQV